MTDLLSLARSQHYPAGALYVVATPIGNAADITLRALHVLELVDAVACEDTRNTAQLLSRYGLSKPLMAAHEHNEREAAARIVARLQAGERIALVSDAGTPAISDPGMHIVAAVRAAGLSVVPLPGASAVIAALAAAGELLQCSQGAFTFVGFLPGKATQRHAALAALATHSQAWVVYEAPHRIAATLAALAECLPAQRRVLIGRELTKLFETIAEMTVAEAPAWLAADAQRERGEFVLVVEGAGEAAGQGGIDAERLLAELVEVLPTKAAARIVADLGGLPKNQAYAQALALKQARGG